jgi:hypothetical protein
MKKYIFLFLGAVLMLFNNCTTKETETLDLSGKELPAEINGITYSAGNWEHPNYTDPFVTKGNHRFEIQTNGADTLVQVEVPWRRHDANPQNKRTILVAAGNDQEVLHKVIELTNEKGHLIFRPISGQNRYFLYYFPHESTGSYYPKVHYLAPIDTITALDRITESELAALPSAKVWSAQSIDDFHSFFPMEVIATTAEKAAFSQANPQPYYLFPEYRNHPIAMKNDLPYHWMSRGPKAYLHDEVSRGEYYTFQIGLFAPETALQDVSVSYNRDGTTANALPAELLTCFNLEGVDLNGQAFSKQVDVATGSVQALWFGVDIQETMTPGRYHTWVRIQPAGLSADSIELVLEVLPETITNRGDDQPEQMSRLRWLNSTVGTDSSFIVPPFIPLEVAGKKIDLLGRSMVIAESGLPASISSFFTQEMTGLKETGESILAAPIVFELKNKNGQNETWENEGFSIQKVASGQAEWQVARKSENFDLQVKAKLEYDGMLNYEMTLVAKNDIDLANTSLTIPYEKNAATYILGLGQKGAYRPDKIDWNWDVEFHQEGLWLGNVNKGLQYVLRDENYERPLNTNFYHNKPLILPSSWGNAGKGGIRSQQNANSVLVENYAGPRRMLAGDTLRYDVRFLVTPFKTIDTKTHFSTRFVHKYVPVDTARAYGGTVINVHHANEINPYINYPFYNLEQQKAYIDEAHAKGVKVKLYNTIRELTYRSHELFAMRSLGTEIFNDGAGGGHGWLQEHLQDNYHSAWHATRVNDASILNKGTSRWTNYYIEGLKWLAKNQEIDGLYLDDIAFSRETVKRISSVMYAHRDEVIIDLHSANQYNERDGYINSVFLYMEHIPYVTRLWFGEYFDYDADPDYWMTEVAGIPFGIPGEMLEKGGHPQRGMVYGMTTRVYGQYDPSPLWKLFDAFGIADARMMGYWVDASPIKTAHRGIKSTIYLKEQSALIVIGSWSAQSEAVQLDMDWETLGWDRNKYELVSPAIKGLQEAQQFKVETPIKVPANEGLFLLLQKIEE